MALDFNLGGRKAGMVLVSDVMMTVVDTVEEIVDAIFFKKQKKL